MTESVTDPVLEHLGPRGRALYRKVVDEHAEIGGRQRVLLEEAARAADRLEQLDAVLRGDERVWAHIRLPDNDTEIELVVDKTLAETRAQQAILARLLSELRQALAPADSKPAAPQLPARPATAPAGPGSAPAPAGKSGGKVADLRARIAAARASAAGAAAAG